jgi:hypothetical protein
VSAVTKDDVKDDVKDDTKPRSAEVLINKRENEVRSGSMPSSLSPYPSGTGEREEGRRYAPAPTALPETQGGAVTSPRATPPKLSPAEWLAAQPKRIPGVGLRIGGNAPRPNPFPVFAGVPPFPGLALLRPAVVPQPPRIPQSASVEEAAYLALKSHRSAVAARFGGCGALAGIRSPEALRRWRGFARLSEGVTLLRCAGGAPAAWVSFSIDAWLAYVRKSVADVPPAPPLSWVYQATRIVDHAEWFAEQGGSEIGGRVVFGPLARELVGRWQRMERELRLLGPATAEECRAIVARHFAPGEWGERVAEARVEGRAMQKQFDDAMARGEWVW